MDTVRKWCDEANLTDSLADRHRGARALAGYATACRKTVPGLHRASLNPRFEHGRSLAHKGKGHRRLKARFVGQDTA
jgi:hypothetical protein